MVEKFLPLIIIVIIEKKNQQDICTRFKEQPLNIYNLFITTIHQYYLAYISQIDSGVSQPILNQI
uniref:Uncharacterized protein n=1 Tax=Rhizophagus irregularis (strain DAOM 181602 / DAOM 197198 / MUCL 43194) TaxID=747089 RepID=U9SW16_RHIID